MNRRRGFSLIELLVVIAIISVLMALLLPAVQHSREAARRTQCKNNLHQIGVALHGYHDKHNTFPPGWLTSHVGNYVVPGYSSWLMAILPDIEQGSLYNALNTELPAWDMANSSVVTQRIEIYICPSDPTNTGQFHMNWLGTDLTLAYSNYVGNLGRDFILDYYDYGPLGLPDGVLFRRSNIRMRDLLDGSSQTLLAGERVNDDKLCRPMWGFGATSVVTADSSHGLTQGEHEGFWGFSSHHVPGCHFVMCDGSAGMINRQINMDIFMALSTRAIGEQEAESPFQF